MYVVKRAFRDAYGMISAGSIIEPADIKRFKHRKNEGHIVEVNEHNFDEYAKFFKTKFGVDLPSIADDNEAPAAANIGDTEPVKEVKIVAAKTNVVKATTK